VENIFPDIDKAQIAAVKPYRRPAPQYTVIDIGALGSGHCMHAGAISPNGMVVGGSDPIPNTWKADAILWSGGKLQDLGKLPQGDWSCAYGVNNRGQVTGEATDSGDVTHAFLWDKGNMRALPDLPSFRYSVARAINAKGQIVGRSYNPAMGNATDADAHAFLWDNGKMRDLGLPPKCRATWAYGINNRGDVVGSAITNDDHTHAFLWSNGKMRDIGTLPGGTLSKAYAINDKGQIVGDSDTGQKTPAGDYIFHAFLWENGVMHDLGVLPGFDRCQPVGINNNGEILGVATTTHWTGCPFVWDQQHGMRLLSTLIPDDIAVYLLDAYAINDRGQMVCRMIHKDDPQRLALITPVSLTPERTK
jgi:probable HAF family extracellular repeat protein